MAEEAGGGGRSGSALSLAIADLVRHLAAQAGVSEHEAFAALEGGKMILPRRHRERRTRLRDIALVITGFLVLLLVLGAMHLTLTTQR
jgi:hypothetical protein